MREGCQRQVICGLCSWNMCSLLSAYTCLAGLSDNPTWDHCIWEGTSEHRHCRCPRFEIQSQSRGSAVSSVNAPTLLMRTNWDLHLILPQPRKTTRTLLRYLKATNFSGRPCRQLIFFPIHVDCPYSCIYALFLSFSLPSPLQVQGIAKRLPVRFIFSYFLLNGSFHWSARSLSFHLM